MSCPDKLALILAVLCEKDSIDLLWLTLTQALTPQSNRLWCTPGWSHAGWYLQVLITRNWLVTSSSFTEENVYVLQKSNKKSCTLDSMPKSLLARSLDVQLPVTTCIRHQPVNCVWSSLFLDKRKKGFVKRWLKCWILQPILLDLSATFNLHKNSLSGMCLMKNRTTW